MKLVRRKKANTEQFHSYVVYTETFQTHLNKNQIQVQGIYWR